MALKKKSILPIIDAKRPITLHITRTDISRSDRKEPSHCAAALACKRMKGVKEARVHLSRVYIRQNNGNVLRFVTPQRLKSEIIAFDRGGQFEPGDYTLYPPTKTTKATGQRTGGKDKPGKKKWKGQPKRKYYRFTNVRTSAHGAFQEVDI